MAVVMVFLYLVIGFLEILYLVKTNQKKQIGLFGSLLILSLLLSVLISMDIEIPSPSGPIEWAVHSIIGNK
jgi:hypothetical protein